ncbi:hypothetical protein I3760_03G153000 [Carya illinoinensis]|nr:hypothetical protein I3760_03G153000 [Carya illinoinensis]
MKNTNQALLAKTGLELNGTRNGLWHSVISSKYLKNNSFWLTSPKPSNSPMWKGILRTKDLLTKGRCFQIFNDRLVKIWFNPWIPTLKDFKPTPISNMEYIHSHAKVLDFIQNNPKSWDIHKMQNFFDQANIVKILKISLSTRTQEEDKEVWSLNHSSKYSVKKTY